MSSVTQALIYNARKTWRNTASTLEMEHPCTGMIKTQPPGDCESSLLLLHLPPCSTRRQGMLFPVSKPCLCSGVRLTLEQQHPEPEDGASPAPCRSASCFIQMCLLRLTCTNSLSLLHAWFGIDYFLAKGMSEVEQNWAELVLWEDIWSRLCPTMSRAWPSTGSNSPTRSWEVQAMGKRCGGGSN